MYEEVALDNRPLYAVSVARLAARDITSQEERALAERAIDRASAWCRGEDVSVDELTDLIHDPFDRGLDLLSQEAHKKGLSFSAAIDAVLCAVTYVAWRANCQKPPVLSLFDSVSEESLAYMEKAALQCSHVTPAQLLGAASQGVAGTVGGRH